MIRVLTVKTMAGHGGTDQLQETTLVLRVLKLVEFCQSLSKFIKFCQRLSNLRGVLKGQVWGEVPQIHRAHLLEVWGAPGRFYRIIL